MRPHFVLSPERKLQRILRVAELAIVQFVAGVLIAIGVQGNRYQPQKDFLSILGTGQHPAPWIFNGTIIILGAALMWFFVSLAGLASRGRFGLLSCCGWGISSAAALMVVGLCPWDRWPFLHTLAFLGWILFLIPMSEAWWCWACEWYSSSFRCWLLNKLVLVVAVAYFPLGMLGLGPLWQKVVVFTSYFWLGCFLLQLRWLITRRQMFRIQWDSSQCVL